MKKNKSIYIIVILSSTTFIGFALAGYLYFASTRPSFQLFDFFTNKTEKVTEKFNALIRVPNNFDANIFATDLGKVRDIFSAPDGIIVSSMHAGKVIYLPDKNNNKKADEQIVLLEDRYNPHGMTEYCPSQENCWFYLAETNAVYRFRYDKKNMSLDDEEKLFDLPDDGGHYTRDILIREDNDRVNLYTVVGSECNACEEKDWRRAKLLISNLDGTELREYARGLRNSVFMTLSPFDNEIYAADMGRDWLGDSLPVEEVNIIKENQDYGWPFCHGDKIHDTEFDKKQYVRNPCEDTIAPIITMPAHSAPLGLDFIPEEGFGEEFHHDLLLAQHGSWNRSTPIGYKVIRIKLDKEGNYGGTEDFLTGFLSDGEAWGRPADVLILPGGQIYVSDDHAGAVYLLEHK